MVMRDPINRIYKGRQREAPPVGIRSPVVELQTSEEPRVPLANQPLLNIKFVFVPNASSPGTIWAAKSLMS